MILVFFVRTSHGGSNRTRPARPILRVGRTAADVSKGNREELHLLVEASLRSASSQ